MASMCGEVLSICEFCMFTSVLSSFLVLVVFRFQMFCLMFSMHDNFVSLVVLCILCDLVVV